MNKIKFTVGNRDLIPAGSKAGKFLACVEKYNRVPLAIEVSVQPLYAHAGAPLTVCVRVYPVGKHWVVTSTLMGHFCIRKPTAKGRRSSESVIVSYRSSGSGYRKIAASELYRRLEWL